MCDVTDYLNTYGMTAKELVSKIIRDIYDTMGMTATAGIGTNLYLCKVAMDILAKHVEPDHNGVRIAELNEIIDYPPRLPAGEMIYIRQGGLRDERFDTWF